MPHKNTKKTRKTKGTTTKPKTKKKARLKSVKNFQQYMAGKNNAELQAELIHLYKTFAPVTEYYASKINPQTKSQIITKYQQIIEKEFIIRSSGHVSLRFSVIRKAISDFKKVISDPKDVSELMLFVVDQGVRFSNSLGGISPDFYHSLEILYRESLRYMQKHQFLPNYQETCEDIKICSSDTGWGFGDVMKEIYEEFFP